MCGAAVVTASCLLLFQGGCFGLACESLAYFPQLLGRAGMRLKNGVSDRPGGPMVLAHLLFKRGREYEYDCVRCEGAVLPQHGP